MMERKSVYFLGIGGIGMSALARYFLHEGCRVGGYDRTRTRLTDQLEAEGAAVHYEDDVRLIPAEFLDPARTIVVYTPAVPHDHSEYTYFREHGFRIEKRSQMLGHLSEGKYVMAVAGTHGKTTTSTLIAWLNRALTGGGSAFLGGISKNFDGNLVLGDGKRLAVEADEFDRSFLHLYPDVAVILSDSQVPIWCAVLVLHHLYVDVMGLLGSICILSIICWFASHVLIACRAYVLVCILSIQQGTICYLSTTFRTCTSYMLGSSCSLKPPVMVPCESYCLVPCSKFLLGCLQFVRIAYSELPVTIG